MAGALKDCSRRNGIVLDPFVGSGTIFIAAEQTGRRCYAMEIDPRYVAVAIARWEHATGRPAPWAVDDRGRLSPAFVEWLMGWPLGHTAIGPAGSAESATVKSRL